MTVVPFDSTVYICKNIPFENNYEHTILFDNATAQASYFLDSSRLVATFGQLSYQRVNSNTIRVPMAIKSLINCNYLFFRNYDNSLTTFENKNFYAFITEVNYINNNTSEIVYELDVMQTWMFDYTLQECLVEREHSTSDAIGDNTIPENFEVSDYIYTDVTPENIKFDSPGQFAVVIAAPFEIEVSAGGNVTVNKTANPGYVNGIFTGLTFNIYNLNSDLTKLENVISKLRDDLQNEIVAIYMIPYNLTANKIDVPSFRVNHIDAAISVLRGYDIDNGFRYKNNKMYTYPFNLLKVQSSNNTSAEFKYELFEPYMATGSAYIKFAVESAMGLPPQIICTPYQYGITGANDYNYNYSLSLSDIPMCSWCTEPFKEWLARTGSSLAGGALALGAAAAVGAVAPAAIPAFMGFAKMSFAATAYGAISNLPKAALEPSQAHGVQSPSVMTSLGRFGFRMYNAHIKREYGLIIDDYFTKYGYAVKRLKVPQFTSRQYWNYIETTNCNLSYSTGLNANDAKKISEIYDHGITFWHTTDVGNYSRNNAIV